MLSLEATKKGLVDIGDRLVTRRKVGEGKSVKEKYTEYIWMIAGVIRRCEMVPRILLRNGKRSKEQWLLIQAKIRGQECEGKKSV